MSVLPDQSNSTLWLIGGCAAPIVTFNEVWTFEIGLAIRARNLYVSGPGLNATRAGERSWFLIQTRESTLLP